MIKYLIGTVALGLGLWALAHYLKEGEPRNENSRADNPRNKN